MEEKKLNILAIQMSSTIGDKKANFNKLEKLLDENFKSGTNLLILPEVWTTGWDCSVFRENAETIDGKTTELLSQLAKTYKTNIVGGSFITTANGQYFNTCPVFDENGNLTATYNKMHLFSYYGCNEGTYIEPGKNPVVVNINGIKTGLSICYDIRFPELYRAYAKYGVELLINTAAWPLGRKIHWESLTKARAIENQCFFVALTQSGPINNKEHNLGESRIIDYKGDVLAEITSGEGGFNAEISVEKMYEFRQKCTVLKDIHQNYNVREQ